MTIRRGDRVHFLRTVRRAGGVVVPAGQTGTVCTVMHRECVLVQLDTAIAGANPPGGLVMFDGPERLAEFGVACQLLGCTCPPP